MTSTRNPSTRSNVWVIIGDKAGDNAQIEAVVARLGWDVAYHKLIFKRPFIKGKPPPFATVYHVDHRQSDRLEPPWPDLILTIGRRPSMAAFWVKKQSGGKTRIVLFGPPKRPLPHYELVIAPVQYALPDASNVLKIGLPLMRVDEERLNETRSQWQPHFNQLTRPIIAVLVGGSTRPYVLDADGARELIERASGYLNETGTLYVTTSRRTAAAAVDALEQALPSTGILYKWGGGEDNPYLALLALADGFVVTGDSMSMMTEVVRLERPLAIFALRRSPLIETLSHLLPRWVADIPTQLKHWVMARLGLIALVREQTRLHRWLYENALAVPAGRPLMSPKGAADDDLERVVTAIRSLG